MNWSNKQQMRVCVCVTYFITSPFVRTQIQVVLCYCIMAYGFTFRNSALLLMKWHAQQDLWVLSHILFSPDGIQIIWLQNLLCSGWVFKNHIQADLRLVLFFLPKPTHLAFSRPFDSERYDFSLPCSFLLAANPVKCVSRSLINEWNQWG